MVEEGGNSPVQRWLDVGTGTGLIALMLAQRFGQAKIDALEPDPSACEDARENFAASPWTDRLHLIAQRLQEYVPDSEMCYDHIVTNPPYFVDALPAGDAARTQARHADSLPYEALLEGGSRLLKPEGFFWLILPAEESRRWIAQATGRGWWLYRRLEVYSTRRTALRRVLMQWGLRPPLQNGTILPPRIDSLLIHDETESGYSDAYRDLTRDFYLRF